MSFLDQLGSALQSIGSFAQKAQPIYNDWQQNNNLLNLSELARARPDLYGNMYANAVNAQQGQQELQMKQGVLAQEQARRDQAAKILQSIGTGGDYKSALAQLASIDPERYGAVALEQSSPMAQLDELTKRAQIANLESENKLRDFRTSVLLGQQPTGINPSAPDPMSVRNNNFGNLRNPQTGDFQQYSTPEEGKKAMLRDLALKLSGQSPVMQSKYGAGYTPTLENVISTWAPPSENDTQNYIDFVSKQTGIDPTKPLSVMDAQRIAPSIAQMEGGQQGLQAYQGGQQDPTEMLLRLNAAQSGKTEDIKALNEYIQNKTEKPLERQKTLTEGEANLRKEFEGLADVKAYRDVESSYERMVKATSQNTGASDIALIFNYMKMLDPGSTVREGEFATAQNSGGIPSYVQSLYNQAVDGQRLTPDQRNNFMSQATAQYQGATELFSKRADQYSSLASQYGYEPTRIVQGSRGKAAEIKTPEQLKNETAIQNLKSRGVTDAQIEEYKKLRGIK